MSDKLWIGKEAKALTGDKDTDTWNVADGFTKIKILRPLINLDRYENMSRFGKQEIEDFIDDSEIPKMRIDGIQRLIFELKQVIGNCYFAIDKKIYGSYLDGLISRLEQVEEVLDGVSIVKRDFVKNEDILEINEEHFKLCFDIIRSVKNELNVLLNNAGLIFKLNMSEEIDDVLESIATGG